MKSFTRIRASSSLRQGSLSHSTRLKRCHHQHQHHQAIKMHNKNSPISILGGGAWGLSTALHLIRSGYTDITVFDRAEEIPSPYSAAYDLNKIVRAEYEDSFYTELALDAIEGWKTPLFSPYYHQTGYIVAATGKAPPKAIHHLEKALESIATHPVFASGIHALKDENDFRKHAWQFSGPLTGFKGYLNRLAGYAHSSDALHAVWLHCAANGVKFVLGDSAGRVSKLLYADSDIANSSSTSTTTSSSPLPSLPPSQSKSKTIQPSTQRCIGFKTADGKTHHTTTTICALGAHAASLIPNLSNFVVARSWSVAHIQLSKRECDLLRGIPTTNIRDLGFFFEPDPETRLFKLCPLGVGYTNPDSTTGISLPPPDRLPPPQDFIPAEDERKLRRLLQLIFPWMADRPFVEKRLCWFADTRDSEYCIDFVPDTDKSLVVLSGDSGHGFKMMPVFGKWVVDLLDRVCQEQTRWRWKDDIAGRSDWGSAVSWRIGEARDLSDVIREKERLDRARL